VVTSRGTAHPSSREEEIGEAPLLALRRAAYRRVLLERELADAVRAARAGGVSWREIGDAVGTSGEAARQRYGA
jgi:hypothetical protein